MFKVLAVLLMASGIAAAATTVEPYGFVKLDSSWDDSRMSTGNYARWVEAEDTNKNDSEFNMTANHSRLGLRITGQDFGGMKTRGLIEGDFYGGGAENKSNPMMRHAWAEVSWPAWDFAVLGGQTSDINGPLDPPVLDPNVLRSAGNIGYRHPQVRLTKGFKIGDSRVDFAVAAVRDVVASSTWFTGDSGADAGYPFGASRLGVFVPGWTRQPVVVGISGSLGVEEWDTSKAGNPKYVRSWTGVVDLSLPLLDALVLKGEGWMGENVANFGAAMLQGISFSNWEPIRAKGGWLALAAGPYKFWKFSAGTGVDRINDEDIHASIDKKRNQSVFGTASYDITPASMVALELYSFVTEYRSSDKNAEAFRAAVSFIHRF